MTICKKCNGYVSDYNIFKVNDNNVCGNCIIKEQDNRIDKHNSESYVLFGSIGSYFNENKNKRRKNPIKTKDGKYVKTN